MFKCDSPEVIRQSAIITLGVPARTRLWAIAVGLPINDASGAMRSENRISTGSPLMSKTDHSPYCEAGVISDLHKAQLASDRTSCRDPLASQMRLILL